MASPSQPGPRTSWAILYVAVLAGVAGLWMESRQRVLTPDPAVLEAAVNQVRAQFEPGDAVVVRPWWEERLWWPLQGAGPGAATSPWPALVRQDRLEPLDLLRFQRVWVIALFGRPATLEGLAPDEARLTSEEVLDGTTRVALYTMAEDPVAARLSEAFESLRVRRVHPDGKSTPCPRGGDRHRCGMANWLDVRVERRDVHHQDAAWLYAHPGPDSAALEVTWPGAPRGPVLYLRAAHTQQGARHDVGTPATVEVLAGGKVLDRFSLERHAYGIERRLVPLGPGAPTLDLVFRVQADHPGWREVMLEADVLSSIPESVRQTATAQVP